MKIAIPVWDGHVSPIFDVARHLRIYDIEKGSIRHASIINVPAGHQARDLREHDVDILICAAISSQLESLLWVSGIEVVADVCGPADTLARAFAAGDTALKPFRCPGQDLHPTTVDRTDVRCRDRRQERKTP